MQTVIDGFNATGAGGQVYSWIDDPAARVALSTGRGKYKKGYQDVKIDKYTRYVADAADMAAILRGEKKSDWPAAHDLAVQETLLKACGLG